MKRRLNNIATDNADSDVEDEQQLVQRIIAQDVQAFQTVLDTHMTHIFRFAYSTIGDASLAEDITQEACLKLWNQADQWKPSGRLISWLLKITHNLCIDHLRSTKSHMRIEAFEFTLPTESPRADEVIQKNQVAYMITQALSALPERQRTAIMLTHYSDCGHAEAAEIMGVKIKAIESLIARGKKRLKELLGRHKNILLDR